MGRLTTYLPLFWHYSSFNEFQVDTPNISIHLDTVSSSQEDDAERARQEHIKYRVRHNGKLWGVGEKYELKLDESLTKSAKEYADELARDGKYLHSAVGRYNNTGENLHITCSRPPRVMEDYHTMPEYIVFSW